MVVTVQDLFQLYCESKFARRSFEDCSFGSPIRSDFAFRKKGRSSAQRFCVRITKKMPLKKTDAKIQENNAYIDMYEMYF